MDEHIMGQPDGGVGVRTRCWWWWATWPSVTRLNAVTWQQIRDLDCRQRHLVIGNHDLTGAGQLRAQGFDRVWSLMVSGGEPPLIWTHYPLNEVPDGYINIHGHVHDDPPRRTPHINVSVEQLDYAPVSLTALRASGPGARQRRVPGGKHDTGAAEGHRAQILTREWQ